MDKASSRVATEQFQSRYGAVLTYPDRVLVALKASGTLPNQIDDVLLTLNKGDIVVRTLDVQEVDGVANVKAIGGAGELPALANR